MPSSKWKPDLSRFRSKNNTSIVRELARSGEGGAGGGTGPASVGAAAALAYTYTNAIDKISIDDALQVQVYHIGTKRTAEFAGFVTDFSDNYTLNWNTTEPFGRSDPMMTYRNTVRNMNLSWEVPSANIFEAERNLAEISKLIQFMYATYEGSFTRTIKGAPLVKIQFTNLVSSSKNKYGSGFSLNAAESGLIAAISNLTATPDLDAGFMSDKNRDFDPEKENLAYGATYRPGMQYPKKWTIDMSMTILHDHKLGAFHKQNSNEKTFPYNQARSEADFRTEDADAEASVGNIGSPNSTNFQYDEPQPTPGQQTVEAIDNYLASSVLGHWLASEGAQNDPANQAARDANMAPDKGKIPLLGIDTD